MGTQSCHTSTLRGFSLIEVMMVVSIIALLALIAVPNLISYRNKAFCSRVERDAGIIAKEIGEYFAIPNHTTIDKESLHATGLTNQKWDISAADPNICVTITVMDDSGRCPPDYQRAMPNWNNNVFTKTMTR